MGESKAPFSDPERAREAGKKGGAAVRELARMRREDPEAYLRHILREETGRLIDALLDAAYGRKSFSGTAECESCGSAVEVAALPPDKRLAAITKALEFAAGKPATQKPESKLPAEAPARGLVVE